MKTSIAIAGLCFLSFFTYSQSLRDTITHNYMSLEQVYENIKTLRDNVNEIDFDTIISCGDDSIKINKAYFTISNLLLPEVGTTKLHNLYNSIDSLPESLSEISLSNFDDTCLFLYSIAVLDLKEFYEERIFYIPIGDSIRQDSSLNIDNLYIKEYNDALHSVGRRMGRLIQSAVLEDPDYVTPSSQTRLDLAISDFKLAEFNLIRAIEEAERRQKESEANNIPTPVLSEERTGHTCFIGASTDLNVAFGLNSLISWQRTGFHFDTGFDLLLSFETELDVLIHPKIGVPVDDFHFLAGLLFSANNSTAKLTGNVYYSRDRLYGGVGFGDNTILFTIGFIGFKN